MKFLLPLLVILAAGCIRYKQAPAGPSSAWFPVRESDTTCDDDPACTPWTDTARKDKSDFDRGVTYGGVLLRIRDVQSGVMQGYDGKLYKKKVCLTHVEGVVCGCDLWETVPPDGHEYTPDLFSRIYHREIADFIRLGL